MDEQNVKLLNVRTESEWSLLRKERDMAQLDYNLIFDEVVNICPGMEQIIETIRNVKPAQFGEVNVLLKQLNGDRTVSYARQRLFDINLRVAVKNALKFYKKYGVNVEDAFQEACIGIWISIDKYDNDNKTNFQTYASTWMSQNMYRNLFIGQYNVRLPEHYKTKMLEIINKIIRNHDEDWQYLSWKELFLWIKTNLDLGEDEIKRICEILIPAESIETVLDENNNAYSDFGELIEHIDEYLLKQTINGAFTYLKDKEKQIVKMRYGYNGKSEMTLQEIGNVFHLTRERVRQIESKAMKKIKWYIQSNKLFENIYPEIAKEELYCPLSNEVKAEMKPELVREKLYLKFRPEFKRKEMFEPVKEEMSLQPNEKINSEEEHNLGEEKLCLCPNDELWRVEKPQFIEELCLFSDEDFYNAEENKSVIKIKPAKKEINIEQASGFERDKLCRQPKRKLRKEKKQKIAEEELFLQMKDIFMNKKKRYNYSYLF